MARRLSLEAETDRALKGRFSLKQLRDEAKTELGVRLPRSPKDGPVGRLIAAGKIVSYPAMERKLGSTHGNGTVRMYRATDVEGMHLGILMDLAREAKDLGFRGQRGRKGHTAEARSVERISPAQFQKIRTMARHVAYFLEPSAANEDDAFAAVRGAYLMWDPAEGLNGDWRAFYELIDSSCPPPSRRPDDRASAKTLLDLAATHGLLLRQARSESYVIPTSWTAVQETWTEAAKHPGVAAVLGVNFLLGAVAEVLGPETEPEYLTTEQVEQVVEHINDVLLVDRSLRTGHKSSIRRSIRRLMEAGLIPQVDVNSWDYRQRHRMAAWSATISNAIAGSVSTEHRGTGLDHGRNGYSAWKNFPFPVLADPTHPYSLARCVDFHTAKGRERDRLGFRGLGSFPAEPARGDSNLTTEYWSEATLKIRLGTLALYVGWIRRHTDIDLESASLADLLTVELLERFVDTVDAGQWSTPGSAMRTLVTIGLIASPCLQDEALKAGDAALATQFLRVSCYATGKGKWVDDSRYDGRPLYKQLEERDDVFGDSVKRQKEEAEAVEAAYRTVFGVEWAYDGMARVYDAARRYVLRKLGLDSMAQLRARWVITQTRPSDLEHLRALAIWNLCLAAPLRTSTHRLLDRTAIVDQRGVRLDLSAPAEIFKVERNGDYNVNLWTAGMPGGFDADLMMLYLMPHGIHHRLLNPDGGTRTSKWLWVNSCWRSNVKRDQVLDATLVQGAKVVVSLAALELGLSAERTDALLAVAQIHSVRHAVAGKLVAIGRIEDARILLHHKGYRTLLAVYAANGRNVSLAGVRARTFSDEPQTEDLLSLVEQATPETRAEILRRLSESPDAA